MQGQSNNGAHEQKAAQKCEVNAALPWSEEEIQSATNAMLALARGSAMRRS